MGTGLVVLVASGMVGDVTLAITPPSMSEGETVTRGVFSALDPADDGVGVTVRDDGTLLLSGSVAALNTYLTQAGKITYSSIAGDIEVTLSAGTGASLRSLSSVLRVETPSALTTPQIGTLPEKLLVTNAYANKIAFTGLTITGAGTLTATLDLPAGLNLGTSLGWMADDVAGEVDATVSNHGSKLTLVGTAAHLQSYLTHPNRIVYNGPGQFNGNPMPVTLTVANGAQTTRVTLTMDEPVQPTTTDQNIRLVLQAADPVQDQPGWVNLTFPRPGSGSTALLVNTADTVDGQVVFVDLEVPRSTLAIAGLAANATGAIEGGAITVAAGPILGSGNNTFAATRFIGTAAALNTFFAAPDKVRYDASSGAPSIAARVGSYSLAVAGAMPTVGTVFTDHVDAYAADCQM